MAILHRKKTLVKMAENAIGSRIFNSLYAQMEEGGEVRDILKDGDVSCASFVSGLLVLTGYLERPHATVTGLRNKLREKKYEEVPSIEEAEPGDILFWEGRTFKSGETHEHVGFLLDSSTAVSTSDIHRQVVQHGIFMPSDAGVRRNVTLILRVPEQPKQS